MDVSIDKGKMTITLECNAKPQPSASGKTLLVASSHGNMPTGVVVDGESVRVGVTAYIPNKQ